MTPKEILDDMIRKFTRNGKKALEEIKSFYSQHPSLDEKKVKAEILGDAQVEMDRIDELLPNITRDRFNESEEEGESVFIYLKAQITKKLLSAWI